MIFISQQIIINVELSFRFLFFFSIFFIWPDEPSEKFHNFLILIKFNLNVFRKYKEQESSTLMIKPLCYFGSACHMQTVVTLGATSGHQPLSVSSEKNELNVNQLFCLKKIKLHTALFAIQFFFQIFSDGVGLREGKNMPSNFALDMFLPTLLSSTDFRDSVKKKLCIVLIPDYICLCFCIVLLLFTVLGLLNDKGTQSLTT